MCSLNKLFVFQAEDGIRGGRVTGVQTCALPIYLPDAIEKYGYAPLDRVREMVALSTELQKNLAVAAHLAHVSYAGQRDETGRVIPRYRITIDRKSVV